MSKKSANKLAADADAFAAPVSETLTVEAAWLRLDDSLRAFATLVTSVAATGRGLKGLRGSGTAVLKAFGYDKGIPERLARDSFPRTADGKAVDWEQVHDLRQRLKSAWIDEAWERKLRPQSFAKVRDLDRLLEAIAPRYFDLGNAQRGGGHEVDEFGESQEFLAAQRLAEHLAEFEEPVPSTRPLPPPTPVRYDDAMQPGDSTNVPDEHVTKRAKKAGAQTTHRPPSHQPGYERKDRQGKVGLLVQLTTEERKQLHAAAKASGSKSTQEFVTLVLAEVAKQYLDEKQQKPTIPEAVERHRDAVRQAALRLVAALR